MTGPVFSLPLTPPAILFLSCEGVSDKRYLVSAGVPGWRAQPFGGGHQPHSVSPIYLNNGPLGRLDIQC